MAKGKTYLYPISVELTDEQAGHFQATLKGSDVAVALRNYANAFLRTYIEGGLMLTKAQLDTIERVTGHRISLPEEVVQFALEAKGRKDGKYTVTAQVDESQWANVEETAKHAGLTPDELLDALILYVISEGWLYSWQPSGFVLHFDQADAEYLRSIVGQNMFHGKDLVRKLKEKAKPEQEKLVGA